MMQAGLVDWSMYRQGDYVFTWAGMGGAMVMRFETQAEMAGAAFALPGALLVVSPYEVRC